MTSRRWDILGIGDLFVIARVLVRHERGAEVLWRHERQR